MLTYPGIWTPAAEVLCLTCHGPMLGFGREGTPTRGYENREVCSVVTLHFCCDKCGRATHTSWEAVDQLANLRDHLRLRGLKAEMEQTGGMCPAVSCMQYRIFASDEASGMFGVAVCDSEDQWTGDDAFAGDRSRDEVVEFIWAHRERPLIAGLPIEEMTTFEDLLREDE
jgi:hypothetical protein